MGTLLASALISQLRVTLLDPSPGQTWTDAMLLGYLNSAERAACLLRPELYTVRTAVPLAAGTDQVLPAGGTAVLRWERNATSKRACRLVDASLVDAMTPFWGAATQEVDVTDYALDPRERTRFRVMPPNNGTGSLIGPWCKVPTAIATVGDPINLDDIYEDPLKQFVLSECYAANTLRQELGKAAAARAEFAKMLGVSAQSVVAVMPRTGVQQPGIS
jgi:hypothetical protein